MTHHVHHELRHRKIISGKKGLKSTDFFGKKGKTQNKSKPLEDLLNQSKNDLLKNIIMHNKLILKH